MVVLEPVQSAIWQCLNNYDFADAIFLGERLYAEVGSDEALHLLATCYYRSGKPQRAYCLLSGRASPTPQCRYLAAQCCVDLNKLAEAEAAITGCSVGQKSKNVVDDVITQFGDLASFALRLLANIYSKTENTSRAVECLQRSLQLNPFLWSSYEQLCLLGDSPDVNAVFKVTTQTLSSICQSSNYATPHTINSNSSTTLADTSMDLQQDDSLVSIYIDQSAAVTPDTSHHPANPANPVVNLPTDTTQPTVRWRSCLQGTLALSPLTPSFGVLPLDNTPTPAHGLTTVAPATHLCVSPAVTAHFKARGVSNQLQPAGHVKPVFSQSGNTNTGKDSVSTNQTSAFAANNNIGLRRSSRLFTTSVKENNKNTSEMNKLVLSPRAPAKKQKSKQQTTTTMTCTAQLNDKNKTIDGNTTMALFQRQSADGLMQLMQQLGAALLSLYQFNCRRAIELFESLPPKHYNTGWVLGHIGRAYFELCDYHQAERVFSEMRRLEPQRVEGLEIYSTVLWHLQSEVCLSALAQDLTDFDKTSPQAWCCAGNCFSLQKEHDIAIRYFQRAIQVDSQFVYAYTLLGHEFVLIDELDKALAAFRNALRLNARHYNAWYGVGMVYYKQEKFVLAEFHFTRALSINPQSSALLCNIGVVQHALKKSDRALSTLDRAIAIDPRNPLCKFHRASVLFASDKHNEALVELEELKQIVPKESLVYFLIAKVHKKLGNTHLALINFSWATDLDPKGTNNHIKEALDKRYMVEDDDNSNASGLEVSLGVDGLEPLDATGRSSLMEADDVQLQGVDSDESL